MLLCPLTVSTVSFFFLTVAGWVFIVVHRLSLVVVCVDFFFSIVASLTQAQ